MQVRGTTVVTPPGTLVPLRMVLGGVKGQQAPAPVRRPDAAALQPLRKAFNDPTLTQATRSDLVKDYFHSSLRPGVAIPATLTLFGHDAMPMTRKGGINEPLVKELRTSATFQMAMRTVAAELKLKRPIEESWPKLVGQLGVASTLKAMTLIYSFYKWQDATGLPEDVKTVSKEAYTATCWINQQRSDDIRKGNEAAKRAVHLPQTMVMNHGSSDTYDNPTHFFAHAWLAYRLREMGFTESQALRTSAFSGAYYEAQRPESLAENHGNAAIKDILMNAEGSDFGIRLFRDPKTALPGAYDGPAAENRDI
jgi:hypothetical protein